MVDKHTIDNEKLILLVKQKPVLWNKSLELYKNRVATVAAWQDILNEMYPEYETKDEKTKQAYGKVVLRRWTHIRDNYNRSCSKIQEQKRSGNGVRTSKPYVYSKQMSFLDKILHPNEKTRERERRNSFENSMDFENTNSWSNDESATSIDIKYEVTDDPEPEITSHEPTFVPSAGTEVPVDEGDPISVVLERPIPITNDANLLHAKLIQILETHFKNEPKATNRHLSFFNGILPTLDDFNDDEVLEFQMGVLVLLKKIKSSR